MRTEKTGLKAIMRAIITGHIDQDMKRVTRDLAAGHEVKVFTTLPKDMKLTYNEDTKVWEFKTEVFVIVDKIHRCCQVEGLLHDTGNVSMMRIRDTYRGITVWDLFGTGVLDGEADADRQIEYDAIA